MRAHMRHLVRRGLYCEIQPVFHRPDCRVLFTRIMGEVAVRVLVQFGHFRKSPIRHRTPVVDTDAMKRGVSVRDDKARPGARWRAVLC